MDRKNYAHLNVLCSAQAFGYGPASKLVTVAKILNKIYGNSLKLDFVGDDIALTYVLQNSRYFNDIIEHKGEYPNLDKYDFVVNVMNPYLAIWAWMNRKKVITIDSLFWFWNWKKKEYKNVLNLTEQLKSTNTESEAWAVLKDVDPHLIQYFSHSLSTVSCVQTFLKDSNIKKDTYRKNIDFQEFGPIIDISHKIKSKKRNKIIITLSGSLSPLNRIKDAERYASLVLEIMEDFVENLPSNIEVFLTTNPEAVLLIKPTSNRIKVVSLNNSDFLDLLNESLIIFTPAGITTIYEALYYDVPIVFLPEQHDGHYKNYLKLLRGGQNMQKLKEIFPETFFNTRIKRNEKDIPDKEINAIKRLIKQTHNNPSNPIVIDMKKVISNYGKLLLDETFRNELIKKQKLQLGKEKEVVNEKVILEIVNKTLKTNNLVPKYLRNLKIGIILADNCSKSEAEQILGKLVVTSKLNIFTLGKKDLTTFFVEEYKRKGGSIFAFSDEVNSYEHDKNNQNIMSKLFNKIYFKKENNEPSTLRLVKNTDTVLIFGVNSISILAITYAKSLGKKVIFFKNNQDFDNLKRLIKGISSKIVEVGNEDQLTLVLKKFQEENYYKL